MSKDPAFLFYPGDYLRDTQCLSESVQVAYDRIMCEHMRNICISQAQLKFFTKRLNEDEIAELKSVLTETPEGFFIAWVAESISKRKSYSESRAKNRRGKGKEDMSHISKTYVPHMENEIAIEDIDLNSDGKGKTTQSREKKTEEPKQPKSENKQNSLLAQLEAIWGTFLQERHEVSYYPNGAERKALKEVGQKLAFQIKEHQRRTGKIDLRPEDEQVVEAWRYVLSHYDKWSSFNQQLTKITQINGQLTSIIAESKRDPSHQTKRNGKTVHHVTPEEAALALHRLHQERSARSGGDGQD